MLSGRTPFAANFVQGLLRLRSVVKLLILGCLLCSGCASTKPYTAQNLPRDLQALPTSNVRTIGLTKLASDTQPLDQINPGDVIEINLVAGLDTDDSVLFSARVNENGYALLPHIGQVYIGGLSLEAAESAIRTACIQGQYYRDPQIVVTMKQRKQVQVTVVGAVEEEGTYYLPAGGAGLLNAISLAGGFTDEAGTTVEVRQRGGSANNGGLIAQAGGAYGPDGQLQTDGGIMQAGARLPVRTSGSTTIKIDLASLGEGDNHTLDLSDGAVVMVERQDPKPLQVLGLVNEPNIYDFPVGKNLHLLDAVAMAGGSSSLVADKVYVIRRRENQREPALIELSMKDAVRTGKDNILLEPGDTVKIEQTPGTVFLETIRVIGFNIGGAVF